VNLIANAHAGAKIHSFETHNARFLQHHRSNSQPAFSGRDVDALRQHGRAFGFLGKGILHRLDRILHRHQGANVLMTKKNGHRAGYSAALRASDRSSSTGKRPA
jgi:hypothetical protein